MAARSCRSCNAFFLRSAFTLIEVLVVVAIIALLISILIPALSRARDQAKRAVCSSNMHQMCLGMSSYATAHKAYTPYRGYFTYDLSEQRHEAHGGAGADKVLVNLGLLIGKKPGNGYVGKNWDVLYCPSTLAQYRDAPVVPGALNGGLKTLWDPNYVYTYGGYNYGLPMEQRLATKVKTGGAPRLDSDIYPRNVDMLAGRWTEFIMSKAKDLGYTTQTYTYGSGWSATQKAEINALLPRMMRRGTQPLVMDFVVGGAKGPHGNGINTMFSDGHARFVRYDGPETTSGTISAYKLWYYLTLHQ